jgi:lipoprotein-anchoring transpeptidase ErfK/SrfK
MAVFIGMIVFLGGLFGQGVLVAQATDQPEQTIKPALTVTDARAADKARSAQPALAISAVLPRPIEKPMLPFAAPQVGPIIKRAFSDDIERRTTAFIPVSLDDLTPIAFPKNEKKWIRVDLSEQITVAYEGNRPIRAFVVSSGLPNTPTVKGEFRIRTKVKAQTMTGGEGAGYYSLPNVKWVQYFYQDYSFHGTYWHNDFGHPKSHGCLNMTNADAKWLFDWAGPTWDGKTVWFNSNADNPGTLVIVHE